MQIFLNPMGEVPDRVAMGGGEFDRSNGTLELFRANFPFPILIEPMHDLLNTTGPYLGELWKPTLVAIPDKKSAHLDLKPGSFVVITSDGFVDTSRRQKQFLLYLRRFLAKKNESLTVDELKSAFLECDVFEDNRSSDDRTVMIFQWDHNVLKKVSAITV